MLRHLTFPKTRSDPGARSLIFLCILVHNPYFLEEDNLLAILKGIFSGLRPTTLFWPPEAQVDQEFVKKFSSSELFYNYLFFREVVLLCHLCPHLHG